MKTKEKAGALYFTIRQTLFSLPCDLQKVLLSDKSLRSVVLFYCLRDVPLFFPGGGIVIRKKVVSMREIAEIN